MLRQKHKPLGWMTELHKKISLILRKPAPQK